MKRSHVYFICFLLFVLLLISPISARPLLTKQGEGEVKADGLTKAASSDETEEEFSKLIGSEECDVKVDECLRRRMVADAHLDYIYTQHNKP